MSKSKVKKKRVGKKIIAFLPLILCLLYLVWMLYITQYATDRNKAMRAIFEEDEKAEFKHKDRWTFKVKTHPTGCVFCTICKLKLIMVYF